MKQFPLRLLILVSLISSLLTPSLLAATKTWTGGGADNNWSTGDNWGGTPPVNGDSLIFSDATRQNSTNDISNLTLNTVTFDNNGFVLHGNPFTVNGVAPAFFTNAAGTNIIAGPLIIGPAPGAKYWYVAPDSELRLTGVVTNTANTGTSIGWLNLTNGGTVRIMGSASSTRGNDLFLGTIIIDGGVADASNDGYVLKAPTGGTAKLQIINNGTLRIGGGGNFRLGNGRTGIGSAAQANGTNLVEINSGLVELYGANVSIFCGDNVADARAIFTQNGGLVWGSAGAGNTLALGNAAGADGTYNLNGGTLWIAQVRQANAGAANAVFNFNGGTLKPTVNSTTFFQGLQAANVLGGGAIIDTTNLNVTIAQDLVGGGGLTKLGSGTLTLSGANTYAGATVVSNGTLVTSSFSFASSGVITVAETGNLTAAFNGASLVASALNVGSSVTNSVTLDFGASPIPESAPVISVGSLNGSGTALINVAGSGFVPGSYPLISFTSASGLSSIKLGTLPLGIAGTLVQVGNTLRLNIALVPKTITWSGAVNGNWDTTTLNWLDFNNGFNPTNYAQSGGNGDAVTFDDNVGGGATSINIAGTVTPSQVTVNNNVNYTFSGAGKISGGTSLTKASGGFAALTLLTANDYSGGTVLDAGTIFLGNSLALGQGPLTLNQGTLASDGVAARTVTNAMTITANAGVVFGDAVNTGPLTLSGQVNLGGGNNRVLTLNSDVILSGSMANGGIATKTGPGQLTITGQLQQGGLVNHQQGDVIIDGGSLDSTDGWRMQNMLAGTTLRFVVTNGGRFSLVRDTGNFRVGLTGGDNSCDNVLEIAGLFTLFSPAAGGRVDMGQSGANDIANLRAGGKLVCRSLTSTSPGYTEVNFDGGTLTPIANETAFLQGMSNVFVRNGGVIVDTTNFNITIAQSLQAGGTGGLTKTGGGTLTLSGVNTYTGGTTVSAGKLVFGADQSSGISVATDASLGFLSSAHGVIVRVPSVTTAPGSALEAQFTGLTNNPTTPAGYITNLVLNGNVGMHLLAANIKIGQFPLFGYGTISGAGSLVADQLPQGVIGTLVTNTAAKTIDLVVSSVTPLVWVGVPDANWNTSSPNWTLSGTSASYASGDNVRFDDSASNSLVTLTEALTPGGVTVSNSALGYQFNASGGALSGSMSLVKEGTNSLALNSANSFLGAITVKAGTLVAGNNSALGTIDGATTIQSGGTLEVNGANLGLEPVIVGGSGVAGAGALNNTGAGQNDALRDVTLTADVVIRVDTTFGIRTSADTDPGFRGNGYKLTKTGPGQLNLNGGLANPGVTIWDSDLGDVEVLEGTLSFQRRMTMGRQANTVIVHPGAALLLFALNTTMPVQTKPVSLNNASLLNNGNNAAEGSTFAGPIMLVGGSNSVAALTGTTLRLQGPISGAGSLYNNSSAAGTVALEGVNTYTGITVIETGTLRLESTASLAATPSIRVVGGATFDVTSFFPWTLGTTQTLAGAGTISGTVLANGTISPGNNSRRELIFNGDLTLAGTALMELNKDNGLTNDTISVSGTLTYGGTLNVVLTGGTPLAVNDTFKLFNFAALSGGSFTLNLPAAYAWDTTQLPVDGTIRVTGVLNPPQINSVSVAGGNLTMTGTGGSAGGTYYVLSSTNVALPLAQWIPVRTNTFGADGSFTNSLPVLSSEPHRFFLLRLP